MVVVVGVAFSGFQTGDKSAAGHDAATALARAAKRANSGAMRLIEPGALSAAIRFPLDHTVTVLAGAGLYALVFTVQSVLSVFAGAGSSGAAIGGLLAVIAAFGAFAVALSGYGRAALGLPRQGRYGMAFSGDALRMVWVALLVAVLCFTVLGTALLVLSFMLAALAMIGAERSGLTDPPEGFINIFALFGPGEWVVAGALIAGFAVFAIWLFARLSLAVPATLESARIRILSVWPASSGRFVAITLSAGAILVPGLALLAGFNAACEALFGVYPGAAQSMVDANGRVSGPVALFAVLSFLHGGLKMVLLAAPLTALFSELYTKYRQENADRL